MTTWETSFRESDHPGIVFPGNVLSGKMTIQESNYPGNDCKPSETVMTNKSSFFYSTLTYKSNIQVQVYVKLLPRVG